MKKTKEKIALFHPWIKSKGGGEKVVLEILKSKKYDAELYTWIYEKEKTFEEFKKFKINIVAPKIFEKISRTYLLRGLFLFISLFSKIPLEKYDKFLISTSGVGEFIVFRNYKPNKTYAYVYTPLRAASKEIIKWNLKNRYKNSFSKLIYLIAIKIYKIFEKIAWKRIDFPIFISELSLKRAKKSGLLEKKKPKIVYPPVDVKKFSKLKIKKGDYFLYVSRFNNPKRQDLLLEAWKNFVKKYPNKKLVLVGDIENKEYFSKTKKLANETKNVEIKTGLSNKEITKLYSNCLAGIFIPFMEDFGIVPFEILAFGKPLIAVNKGGYVKLIENVKQFHKIKELYLDKEMIKEISRGLEKFIKSKKGSRRVIIEKIAIHNFMKKIEDILIK